MKKVENKTKKKKIGFKKWFKNINWTRIMALILVIVMLGSFIYGILYPYLTSK